jgi:hypothetical protein
LLLLFRAPIIGLDGCQLSCLFTKLQLCCDSRAMPMQYSLYTRCADVTGAYSTL